MTSAAHRPRPREPSVERLRSPWKRYLAATRPGFLSAAFAPALIGLATATQFAPLDVLDAILTVIGVLAAHAGINALNDVYDHYAGCDAINEDRIFPFTGGSRLIQNGVLNVEQMTRVGWSLMAVAAIIGLVLLPSAGPVLIAVGLTGLLIGWAYSAPPVRLSARGLGELAVGIGFGMLIPIGAALVQLGRLEPMAAWAGASYAFMISAVLFVNQFPDVRADAHTGKRNLVVRLGPRLAWRIYPFLVLAAYTLLFSAVVRDALPPACLLGIVTVPLHAVAAYKLWAATQRTGSLLPPIQLTLLAANVHALLIAFALLW